MKLKVLEVEKTEDGVDWMLAVLEDGCDGRRDRHGFRVHCHAGHDREACPKCGGTGIDPAARQALDALIAWRVEQERTALLAELERLRGENEELRAKLPKPMRWQCSVCRWAFEGAWKRVCPACGKEHYWTGSVHPEAKLWEPPQP